MHLLSDVLPLTAVGRHLAAKLHATLCYWPLLQATRVWESLRLASDELLGGTPADFYEHRLTLHFQRHDIHRAGTITRAEFEACLEDVEGCFSAGEAAAMWHALDDLEEEDDGCSRYCHRACYWTSHHFTSLYFLLCSYSKYAEFLTMYTLFTQKQLRVDALTALQRRVSEDAPLRRHYRGLLARHLLDGPALLYSHLAPRLRAALPHLPKHCLELLLSLATYAADERVDCDAYIPRCADMLLVSTITLYIMSYSLIVLWCVSCCTTRTCAGAATRPRSCTTARWTCCPPRTSRASSSPLSFSTPSCPPAPTTLALALTQTHPWR